MQIAIVKLKKSSWDRLGGNKGGVRMVVAVGIRHYRAALSLTIHDFSSPFLRIQTHLDKVRRPLNGWNLASLTRSPCSCATHRLSIALPAFPVKCRVQTRATFPVFPRLILRAIFDSNIRGENFKRRRSRKSNQSIRGSRDFQFYRARKSKDGSR